jgi:hypothetical protein
MALAVPATTWAQEVAHGVTVLLPPSAHAAEQPPAVDRHPAEAAPDEGVVPRGPSPLIVVTAPPRPVPGWEKPPEIEVMGLDDAGDVVVYSPAPEPMPGWRKLQGVDIRYHRMARLVPGRIPTRSWHSDAPSRIPYHPWPSAYPARIPYARTGSALVAQSWNPYGPRFEPSRIRYHGWPR